MLCWKKLQRRRKMETEQAAPSPTLISVVDDVLQHHEIRRTDIVSASRNIHEASTKRYEAADWLRKMVGVGGGSKDLPSQRYEAADWLRTTIGVGGGSKDLPSQPSEEEFKNGLRSGIILCNVLNKVQPGRIAKVVEDPGDSFMMWRWGFHRLRTLTCSRFLIGNGWRIQEKKRRVAETMWSRRRR
ncbi:Kinesin-like protein KIN-14G [Linum perenne]